MRPATGRRIAFVARRRTLSLLLIPALTLVHASSCSRDEWVTHTTDRHLVVVQHPTTWSWEPGEAEIQIHLLGSYPGKDAFTSLTITSTADYKSAEDAVYKRYSSQQAFERYIAQNKIAARTNTTTVLERPAVRLVLDFGTSRGTVPIMLRSSSSQSAEPRIAFMQQSETLAIPKDDGFLLIEATLITGTQGAQDIPDHSRLLAEFLKRLKWLK